MTGSELICCLGVICILCGIGCIYYSRAYCLKMFCDFETEQIIKAEAFQNQTVQQIDEMTKEIESLKEQVGQQAKSQQNKNQIVDRLIDVINSFKNEPVESDLDFEGDTQVEDFDEVEIIEDDSESGQETNG